MTARELISLIVTEAEKGASENFYERMEKSLMDFGANLKTDFYIKHLQREIDLLQKKLNICLKQNT